MKTNLEKTLTSSFLDYSAFVLQRRAIPDARDMFKYTARQIVHAQHINKLDYKHPFKKSQKSVAAATSYSYCHGGNSCYEQIVRMGRPLVQRYYFEEINGNGGTPTGSNTYSAERYTEARLSKLSSHILTYLEDQTIGEADWEETYDGEGLFPKVFPSVGYYNLCNGSFGSIGVGLISSIPQFNLREVNAAIQKLILNPEEEVELLPDFASGGVLLNPRTTASSLALGEGKSAVVRGRVTANTKEKYIEVTELPYGVYTNTVCIELERAAEKGVGLFTHFKDLSKTSVRLRIYGKDLQALEEWLYENTSVQKHFSIKMILLDKGKTPKLFTLKGALLAHIIHASTVFMLQYQFTLKQLIKAQEILEGLIKAHSIVDEIIALVRNSSGRTDVIKNLQTKFEFTERQAEAIAEVKTYRWSSLDIAELNEKLEANLANQKEINDIVSDQDLFNEKLCAEYQKIADEFGDDRRTEIATESKWESKQQGQSFDSDFFITFDYDKEEWSAAQCEHDLDKTNFNKRIEAHDEVIFLTSLGRGITRQAAQFVEGEIVGKVVKLKEGEELLQIFTKQELGSVENVIVTFEDDSIFTRHHTFFTLGSSSRGKTIIKTKKKIVKYSLDNFSENE